jgi:hypothetical protein
MHAVSTTCGGFRLARRRAAKARITGLCFLALGRHGEATAYRGSPAPDGAATSELAATRSTRRSGGIVRTLLALRYQSSVRNGAIGSPSRLTTLQSAGLSAQA